jgi:threonine dehydratase
MDFLGMCWDAAERIRDGVRETPVEPSPALSERTGARVHLKLENYQRTGSFKLRGALNALLSLDEPTRARGVVAASSGNHGAAVACAAASAACEALIFVPEGSAPSKLEAVRTLGAEVRVVGEDCLFAEQAARLHATEHGMTYLSPYNDERVVAGQGTIGVELERQLPHVDAVCTSMGGGGLISGIGGYLKSLRPNTEVLAFSPAHSCVMHASLEAGEILDLPSEPTLSDGTAGGVEADSITFELCRQIVDESFLVSEEEIAAAMRTVLRQHHMLIEGAAGVAVAGFLKASAETDRWCERDVVIVLCGANVDPEVLKKVL